MAERLDRLPRRSSRTVDYPYDDLADLKPWLFRRGVDFEPHVNIETVRRRVRRWAERNGYSRADGFIVNTRVVKVDPDTGQSYRAIAGVTSRDTKTKPEYGLAIQIERNESEARRRLRPT